MATRPPLPDQTQPIDPTIPGELPPVIAPEGEPAEPDGLPPLGPDVDEPGERPGEVGAD